MVRTNLLHGLHIMSYKVCYSAHNSIFRNEFFRVMALLYSRKSLKITTEYFPEIFLLKLTKTQTKTIMVYTVN